MSRLRGKLLTSYMVNTILVVLLFFLAAYLFIGSNFYYLSKSQDVVNDEFLALADYLVGKDGDTKKVDELFHYAEAYNLGVRLELQDGRTMTKQLTEQQRVFKLEFGGTLATRDAELKTNGGSISITYFAPYFAADNTVKFFPALLRLTLIVITFALCISIFAALFNAASIGDDLKKLNALAVNLIKGSDQNISGRLNLAEFKQLQEKLSTLREVILKKEQLKKRMTSDFAHELRTPLSTLQSHLEALIDGIWEPTKERFASCHEEILRLIRLVGDLEKLYKFEDENTKLNKISFDLSELIKSISVNFEGEMRKKKISFSLTGPKQMIRADRDKISQVIVNLLSNSLKYTPREGNVLVNIKGDQNYVYITVNDSGIGIPDQDIAHVFNRLYRSDASRARASGGAGIGLTVAKSIVEAHNGSIDIVSQEGLGTEVTVILPRS